MVRKHLAALVAGVAVFAGSGFSQAQTLKLGEVTYNRGFVQQIPDKGAGDQMVGVFKPHLALLAADKNHGKGMNPANLKLATGSAVRFTIGADASTKSGQTTTSSTFIVVPVVGMDRSKFEATNISTMVSAKANAVESNARAKPSVTVLSDSSSTSGVTPAIAPVIPKTVPKNPKIGIAQVMKRVSA